MLKAHQACIDLEKDVLRIQGREVKFLSEHELPDKARIAEVGGDSNAASGSGVRPQGRFPGSGAALGMAPRSVPVAGTSASERSRQPTQPQASRYPETSIQTLVRLGVTREQAIATLDAADGNVDMAASLLF